MNAPRKRKTKRQAAAANAAAVLFYPRSRAPPMAAGGPVPVGQIAATIAADGDNGPRSSHPPAFSTVSHGKNAASAGARPSPSRFHPRLPPAERTPRRRAALASPPRRTRARPGRKRTFPFTTLPAKMKKNAPPGRKTYLVTRHPPRTIKKQAADSGEKRSSPLPDGRHKKQKNRTPDLDVLQVWMRQQPNLPWGDPKVLSAQESLTSVFGMRTGGSSPLSSPQWLYNPHALARGFIYKL